MNNLVLKENNIENMIYEIRGKQVMLDSDLADLYGVETKRINEAVKRNINKFPDRFSFILTDIEIKNIFLVANCDQKIETRGGKYKKPRVFTEQGIAMLATILKTPVAIDASIKIMDAFVLMKKYISNDLIEQKYVNNLVIKNDNEIKILQNSFNKIEHKEPINEIYFEGQIYDAYSKIIDIMNKSKEELIIIDNYADKNVLDMISKIKVKVILITRKNNLLKQIDIDKYNKQYNNLKITYDNTFHDRYIIIDKKIIYHCGSSLNHIGTKTFSINILEDLFVKQSLLDKINRQSK